GQRGIEGEGAPEDGVEEDAGAAGEAVASVVEAARQQERAGGVQGRIGGGEVIGAAAGDDEQGEGDKVHPGEGAEALAGIGEQVPTEAKGGNGSGEESDDELAGEEAVAAALSDVAGVNVAEEVEGDEMVARLPDQVGGEDEQGHADTGPQPGRFQMLAPGRGEEAQAEAGGEH